MASSTRLSTRLFALCAFLCAAHAFFADDRREALSVPEANIDKMNLGSRVKDCLHRELEHFQKRSVWDGVEKPERMRRYDNFINEILPSCVQRKKATATTNSPTNGPTNAPGSGGPGNGGQSDSNRDCRPCYSGCHFCCIGKGTPGFTRCWRYYCDGKSYCK